MSNRITVSAAAIATTAMLYLAAFTPADEPDGTNADANVLTLQPRQIASNVSAWRVLPDSRLVLIERDKAIFARRMSADGNAGQTKLKQIGPHESANPRHGLDMISRVGPDTLGFTSRKQNAQGTSGGYTVVNLASGKRSLVLDTAQPVLAVPVDANTALLVEPPIPADPNDNLLKVHRLDVDTLQAKALWTRQGVHMFGNAQPAGDDPNKVRLWFYLPYAKPRHPVNSTQAIAIKERPVIQVTLNIKTGKATEITLDRAEAENRAMPRGSWNHPFYARRGKPARRIFTSRDGKVTVSHTGSRVLLTRRGTQADMFGGQYSAKVYPSSDSAKPRRLAIVKAAGEKRELIVMDLKTLDKTRLAEFTELDSVTGWSPGGRFLVAEQYSPTNLDDHGHLVAYEPARWRKVSIFPQENQKYVTLLGFVPGGWAMVAGDTMIEDAIRKTRLSAVDLTNPKRRYTVAQGRLFRVTAVGDELIFSDFDGEHYTLYRAAMPEKKKTPPRRDGDD